MLNREILGNQNKMRLLAGRIAIGAAGAPTLATGARGYSIVRNSAGNYTMTLDNARVNLGVDFWLTPSGPAAPSDIGVVVWDDTALATTGKINIFTATRAAPTVAADPPNPSLLMFQIIITDSDVG